MATAMRVGQGFDIDRFEDTPSGRVLVLGGVQFVGERALVGHSDADVIAHAIADALLGAASLGDIGQHFQTPTQNGRELIRCCCCRM